MIILGISGWGIAWYLNELLIPKIELYRGFEYTFIVEGGDDPTNPARYHPFYITNNERGGYLVKSEEERKVRAENLQYRMVQRVKVYHRCYCCGDSFGDALYSWSNIKLFNQINCTILSYYKYMYLQHRMRLCMLELILMETHLEVN